MEKATDKAAGSESYILTLKIFFELPSSILSFRSNPPSSTWRRKQAFNADDT